MGISKKETQVDSTAIKRLIETASGTIEAIQYAVAQARGRLERSLVEGLDALKKLTEKALDHSSEEAWKGNFVHKSRSANLLASQVDEALQNLDDSFPKDMHLDLAISDNAKYMYRYLTNDNKELTEKELDIMEKAFHGWLIGNGIVVMDGDGSLYHEDEKSKGEAVKDDKGNNKRVDAEQFRKQVTDPEKGFSAYMKEKGFTVEIQQVEYPRETAAPAA